MNCCYCNRECKNKNSKAQHEMRCNLNPNKKDVKPSYGMLGKRGSNQHLKAKQNGYTVEISLKTRERLSVAAKNKKWSNESRKKLSESMKRAVELYPDSYSVSNRGRTRRIDKHGISFQGKWELYFYEWCLANNLSCNRCRDGFKYEWNGTRKYFPDFFLPSLNVFIEVKGFQTEQDLAKWRDFPHHLIVVRKKQIMLIQKNAFTLNDFHGMLKTETI